MIQENNEKAYIFDSQKIEILHLLFCFHGLDISQKSSQYGK